MAAIFLQNQKYCISANNWTILCGSELIESISSIKSLNCGYFRFNIRSDFLNNPLGLYRFKFEKNATSAHLN